MSLSPIHLTALRALEATARLGSMKAAAAELGVTPTAIGQQVRGLEAYLGQPLFRRALRGQRLVPTAPAQMVLADLTRAMADLGQVMARLRRNPEGRPGLVISVSPAFAARWLIPRLREFARVAPEVMVRLEVTDRLVDLATDGVDMAVRYGQGGWTGVSATLLMEEVLFPVASPALVVADPPLRMPSDLARHRLIHDSTVADRAYPSWSTWMALAGVSRVAGAGDFWMNSAAAALQAAEIGQGVALGRSAMVRDALADGRLVRPFAAVECPAGRSYWLVTPPRQPRPAVTAFTTWIHQQAKLSQPESAG